MSQHPETHPDPAVLDITDRVVEGTLVVTVAGEIDLDTVPVLHAAVTDAIRRTAGEECIVDLTAVTFLGSAGLAALVDAANLAEARREPLRIVVDSNRPVIRPIVVTGLDDVLALYHTVEEALRAGHR
ncbi:anti-sigma factor antagonist [Actinophytocola sp.]|uniref:anti-sigma factor antagonist n=1 Tax=Actinophytocola sp. TaxID=1872138 RepID=UPI00389A62AA